MFDKWKPFDRGLLGLTLAVAILLSSTPRGQQCDDPCQFVGIGQCDCLIDYSYYGAMVVGCCCGWWICWQGVWVEAEQYCSANCNDDVFYCINPAECGP